jgi:hypothetical protein
VGGFKSEGDEQTFADVIAARVRSENSLRRSDGGVRGTLDR